MRKLIITLYLISFTTILSAKTYLRQNSFYAPESMTTEEAQVKAINEMKSQLIQELFSYAKFTTLWNTINKSDTLSSYNIEMLKPKVTLKDIIDESREDNVYYINAEFQADENDIMDEFRDMFTDKQIEDTIAEETPKDNNKPAEDTQEYVKIPPKHMQQEEKSPTTLTLTGDAYELFQKGVEAQNMKLYKDALSWYEQSLEKDPNNAQAHNNMGIILSMLGAHEASIQHFKEALKINPELPQVYNNLGNAQESLGKLTDAIKTYEMAISVQPNYTDGYYNLARIYTEMREFDKAESTLNKLLEIDKNNPYAYYGMGNMFAKKRDFDEAIKWYEKAIELRPNYAEAHYKLGVTYGLQGDMDKGIEHINYANSLGYSYEDGVVIGDDSSAVTTNSNVIATDTQTYDDGSQSTIVYKTEDNPPPVKQPSEQVNQESEKQTSEQQTKDTTTGTKTESVNTDELYKKFEQLLGKTDATAGDVQNIPEEVQTTKIDQNNFSFNTEGSQNQFDFLLKDKIKDTNTKEFSNKREAIAELFKDGYTAFMNGDYDTALDAYLSVIDLDKENSMALYSAGTVYAYKKENDNAIDYLKRSIDKNNEFSKAYDNAGIVYYNQGRYNSAIEYLLRAVQLDSTSVNALVVLGDSYEQVGNNDKKIQYYKKAARLGDMQARDFLKEKGFTWQ